MCELGRSPIQSGSMSSAEGFHARIYRQPEQSSDLMEREAGFGESLPASFAYFDRDSSLWKTRQRSFIEGWETFSATWPEWGLMLNGECFGRVPLVLHTCEPGCSSLPTLTVVSCEHPGRRKIKSGQQDCISGALHRRDRWEIGGQYSPSHAAWFMGFPDSWTDLDHTETPSSPKSPNGSDDAS